MNSEKKSGGAFAVLSLVAASLFLVLMFISIAGSHGWVLGEDLIGAVLESDSSLYMKSGIALGGLFLAFGSIGIVFGKGRPGRSAEGAFLLISGILMVWIAFFEAGNNIHDIAVTSIFATFVLAMVASMYDDFKDGRSMLMGALTVFVMIVSIGAYISYDMATYQMVWIIAAVAWIMVRSVKRIAN